jgi:hypothetical protein
MKMADKAEGDYVVGELKVRPDGRAVAIRNEIPNAAVSWSVMTVDQGGHHTDYNEVKDWPDLPYELDTTPPEEPQGPPEGG